MEKILSEDYCSYELSKLLKEKGFNWNCHKYDFEDWEKRHSTITSIRPYNFNEDDKCISIPTHQMAMKWLREKDIDVIIMPLFKLKEGRIYCYEIHSDNTGVRTGQFKTYEEAVEAALKYVLENLI